MSSFAARGNVALPPLTVLCRSLALVALEGASVGLGLWALRVGESLRDYVVTNTLPPQMRRFVVLDMTGGALVALMGATLLLVLTRTDLDRLRRVAYRSSPLLTLWIVPLLFHWQIWHGRELQFLLLVTVFGALTQRTVRLVWTTPPVFDRVSTRPPGRFTTWLRSSRALPAIIVVFAAAFYAAFFGFHTVRNHYRLGTASLDLGLESNLVWNVVHGSKLLFKSSPLGGPTATHAGFHQTYFAFVLGIPFYFWQRAETLLIIQAILMGAAAIPLYLIAQRRLSRWVACLLAVLYVIYPPLQGANLYDFHYLPLGTFFLWMTLYLIEAGHWKWTAFVLLLTISLREDISALLVILGGYLLLRGQRPVAGLIVSAIGAAYFVTVKMFVMPRFLGGSDSFVHQYVDLLPEGEHTFGAILKTVIGNFPFTLETLLTREKLTYVAQIAVPLAFFPWRRPVGYLCSVPGFFFTLLATKYPPLLQTSFQYTAYWTTFLFLAVVDNLAYFQEQEQREPEKALEWRASRHAWTFALTASMIASSYQLGAFFQQNTIRGGFGLYRFDLKPIDREHHQRLYALIAQLPPNAKVVSSETIVPQVASRPDSYTLRMGLFDAEYILAWLPGGAEERRYVGPVLKDGSYGVVDVQGEFVLAKKGYSTAKNADVARRYGL